MKFVIRRAVVGALAIPMVAGAYVFGYVGLVAWGAEPSATLREVWNSGITIGVVAGIAFTFATQLNKFVSRVVGE